MVKRRSPQMHAVEYFLSSPRRRGPILSSFSIGRNPRHIAWTRRMGPRLRGDDKWSGCGALLVLAFLACLIAADAFAAPLPSHLGPEVAITRPRDGYVGRLNVSPENGPAGTEVTVSADQLPPNQELVLVWRTVKGNWKVDGPESHGRDFKPVGYEVAKVESDHDGRLSARFVVPEDFGFAHDIVLQQGDRLLTQVNFSLDMTVEISPKEGPLGTPITVTVKGIGWRPLFNSWLLLYDNRFTGWMSAVTSGGSAKFTIPATGNVGDHIIEVLHGEFIFPYRNMQQNPEPDRPRWAIPFTITAGAPVLPPSPQQQAQKNVRVLPPPGEIISTPRFSGVGEPIKVSTSGLQPGKSYKLNWTRVIGNRMTGRGWSEDSKEVAEAKADAQGKIEYAVKTPDDLGGAHGFWIDLGGGKKKQGTHLIKTTAFPVDVTKGPVGTKFTLHLKGGGWTETANIMHLVYDNSYNGYACAFNSQGDIEIFVQATGAPGWHFIDLYPGIYKGMEVDPNNFKIPQLTYAQDHPGEDLTAFHFAFEVTPSGAVKQAQR